MHVGAYITCARAHGKNVRWCNRGEPARGVRLPLSTPLRYQPRLDIINGNAIFSSAMQFRVPLSRIRSSVLYADLSIPPPPSSLAPPPRLCFLLFLFPSVWSAPFIYLFPPALLHASVILYTFRSCRSNPANEHPLRFPRSVFIVDEHETHAMMKMADDDFTNN